MGSPSRGPKTSMCPSCSLRRSIGQCRLLRLVTDKQIRRSSQRTSQSGVNPPPASRPSPTVDIRLTRGQSRHRLYSMPSVDPASRIRSIRGRSFPARHRPPGARRSAGGDRLGACAPRFVASADAAWPQRVGRLRPPQRQGAGPVATGRPDRRQARQGATNGAIGPRRQPSRSRATGSSRVVTAGKPVGIKAALSRIA